MERRERGLRGAVDEERHVVVVDAGVDADALTRIGGAEEPDRVGRRLVVVGAEDQSHVGAGRQRRPYGGLHPLRLVLEQADRLDGHDDGPPRGVADRDGAGVDRVVHPLEQVIDAARRVEPVVATVQVRVAVLVALVVEEARAVPVDVRLLEGEEARSGEDGLGARREHGRIGGRIEGGRRHVHPGRAEQVHALRAGRAVRQRDERQGREEAPHHCAAITSAMVKGIGLYSKRS